ncbi:NADH dehydrogenase [ubiquinone] 1 alpha subcomplex assembly factor 2-like [Oppia nitens]|uniref:NADH dehydrogenase [ubiquinone] 1 alpha subcomplex assembly factor 2-like n=1 Tax=Oppia nitens TaxID=1686743 RepID=UPI0023DA399E|nr:NADH dehydrogenase [ubiquinone] 1 alpha subcomplex assembly factor 2-like [Oppia nitens]
MSYRGRSSLSVIFERFIDSLKPKHIKTNTKHMGTDYLGNNYYECLPKKLYDSRQQPRRWFKPPNEDLWDRQLPPEWNAWLRMMRKIPPTIEEIEYNRMIENKKQQFSQSIADPNTQTNKQKVHPVSGFPIYDEYKH